MWEDDVDDIEKTDNYYIDVTNGKKATHWRKMEERKHALLFQ